MSTEYGIIFLKEKCVQCHGCDLACKAWRDVELGVNLRIIKNLWQGTYPNVKNFAASIACMHCAEPACVDSCPENAIKKGNIDGIVVVDQDACTGCRACMDACPFEVPQFGADGKMTKCDLCNSEIDIEYETPPCVATCPTNALQLRKMSREEKISAEQSIPARK